MLSIANENNLVEFPEINIECWINNVPLVVYGWNNSVHYVLKMQSFLIKIEKKVI